MLVTSNLLGLSIQIEVHNHVNQYPDCNWWKCFSVPGYWLSQREMSRNAGVSQGAIWKVLRHVHKSSSLTQRLHRHILKTITSIVGRTLLRIIKRKSLLSESKIRVKGIRRTERLVSVHKVERQFVADCHRSRHPGRCPRLTSDYCCCCHILADWAKNSNHQHWSDMIFDYESRNSLYHSGCRTQGFHLYHGYSDPLAFLQHNKKFKHVHYICRSWLWTHQQTAYQTSADDSNSGSRANMQQRRRISRVSLGQLSGCFERYPSSLGPCSTPILNTETTQCPIMMRSRALSSFDMIAVIVFNRRPCGSWIWMFTRTRRKTFVREPCDTPMILWYLQWELPRFHNQTKGHERVFYFCHGPFIEI